MIPGDAHDVRDPELPGLLLRTERDALIPLLRARPEGDFARPTAGCPAWTVRELLAHCSAALMRVVESRFEPGVFSPEANDRDIAERGDWPTARVIDELERGMTEAGRRSPRRRCPRRGRARRVGPRRGRARGVRGSGRLRGRGTSARLTLLVRVSRERDHVPLHADLDDLDDPLRLGGVPGDRPPARYIGGAATLVRLCSGRPVAGATKYELVGAEEEELNLFG